MTDWLRIILPRYIFIFPPTQQTAAFLSAFGLPQRPLDDVFPDAGDAFVGAIFLAGDSWIELWPEGPEMPTGTMLQIVVDDADAFAQHARDNGLTPQGPTDAYGERIYFLTAPDGSAISFQSRLAEGAA